MAQEIAYALHDGKTQAETAVALAGWVVELMEFLEDRLQLSRGNAYAGVPHLDAQLVAASAAAEQDLAPFGIFYGVRQQVAERLLEQTRIAAHVQAARDHAPTELLRRSMVGELGSEAIEHGADLKLDDVRTDDPRLELIDIEQRIQHARHRAERLLELRDQPGPALILDPLPQYPAQQAEGLQRLAQVMAGGGEEARLSEIGLLRQKLGGLQRLARSFAFGDVIDHH